MTKEELGQLSAYYLLGMEAIKDAESPWQAEEILTDLWLEWGMCFCMERITLNERDDEGNELLSWDDEWVIAYVPDGYAYIGNSTVGKQIDVMSMLHAMQIRVDIIEYEIRKRDEEDNATTVRAY